MNISPFLATDAYKLGHHKMYPKGTTKVYSNFTPRTEKYADVKLGYVISFGQQMVMRQIYDMFEESFFMTSFRRANYRSPRILDSMKDSVIHNIKTEYEGYLGADYDMSHIEELYDHGRLPIKVKAIPEGSRVPIGVPVLTIVNTEPEFFWLTNFLETLISNLLWKPITSATIAHGYRKVLQAAIEKTDKSAVEFVNWQGHDFSMRGMDSIDAVVSSGLGHLTSFHGSDSLPVIAGARYYYNEPGFIAGSVNATEHSVMSAGGAGEGEELATFRHLMSEFPTGILSIVSDTWNLWDVLTKHLPILKDEILARDGKIVIRPDSGDPADIICGIRYSTVTTEELNGEDFVLWLSDQDLYHEGILYSFNQSVYDARLKEYGEHGVWEGSNDGQDFVIKTPVSDNAAKGVIELLWDLFGGTINEQGYKVLDSHIGAIYGDSITISRAKDITDRLAAKGFASSNVVLGVGSFTYQFNTRDTYGFAMKATYCEVKSLKMDDHGRSIGREIFKDPITDDGTKKSLKGLITVEKIEGSHGSGLIARDQCSAGCEDKGELQVIFEDGQFFNPTTLTKIRAKLI